jgi:transcriptional regulator with XRE-family HTH domain
MSIKQKYGLKDLEKEYGPLTFGEALESYRLGEEISQADMAKIIGISAQSLCDIEKGRRIPTPKRAAKIAQVIGESEMFWIKLALQDGLRKEDLKFDVFLKPSAEHVKATHFDQTAT